MLDDYSDCVSRIDKALELAITYGGVDGNHHKAWVIDQMVRALADSQYDSLVAAVTSDGEEAWDVGIAP